VLCWRMLGLRLVLQFEIDHICGSGWVSVAFEAPCALVDWVSVVFSGVHWLGWADGVLGGGLVLPFRMCVAWVGLASHMGEPCIGVVFHLDCACTGVFIAV
jgi:hypothetical protein